jgi:CRAL/TRIO domain
MKDCAVATMPAAAAPPVHDRDNRPALVDVIATLRTKIDRVAAALAATDPLYQPNKHDDVWIARFLLSHKKVKAATKAALYTLLFRAQHKLDETDIRFLPVGPNVPCESFQKFYDYCNADTFQVVVPDAKLGVVSYIDIGGVNQHDLVQNVDESHWLPSFIYVAEFTHQWCDYLSRTTGRLTSSVRIVDASKLSWAGLCMENTQRDSRAMKATQDCYPQMLECMLVCQAPAWIQTVWRVVRPLFPKRVVEKTDFLTPATNERDRNRLLKYISLENLPARYGGHNHVWPMDFPLLG